MKTMSASEANRHFSSLLKGVVRGANSIIALRGCNMSNRWEDFWEDHAAA
jgi:hypothetical protein